jgi:hypothetical protein
MNEAVDGTTGGAKSECRSISDNRIASHMGWATPAVGPTLLHLIRIAQVYID